MAQNKPVNTAVRLAGFPSCALCTQCSDKAGMENVLGARFIPVSVRERWEGHNSRPIHSVDGVIPCEPLVYVCAVNVWN